MHQEQEKYQGYIIPMALNNSSVEKCLPNSNIKPTTIVEYFSFTNFYASTQASLFTMFLIPMIALV